MKVSLKFTITITLATIAIAILLPTASAALEANSSSLEILNPDDYECDSENRPLSISLWIKDVTSALTEEQLQSYETIKQGFLGLSQSSFLRKEIEFRFRAKQYGDDPPSLFYGGKKQGKALFKVLGNLRSFWNFPEERKVSLVALRGDNALDKERFMAWFLSLTPENPDLATLRMAAYTTFLETNDYDPHNPLYTVSAFASFEGGIAIGDGVLQFFDDGADLGKAAVEHTLAHEWGHELQFWIFGVGIVLRTRRTPVGSRYLELMADAFAGYFLHHPQGMSRQTKNIKDAAEAAFSVGDCDFSQANHHGTPLQRERITEWAVSLVDENPAGSGKAKILTAEEFYAKFVEVYPSIVAPDVSNTELTFSTNSILGVDYDPKANEHTNSSMAMATSFWALLFMSMLWFRWE